MELNDCHCHWQKRLRRCHMGFIYFKRLWLARREAAWKYYKLFAMGITSKWCNFIDILSTPLPMSHFSVWLPTFKTRVISLTMSLWEFSIFSLFLDHFPWIYAEQKRPKLSRRDSDHDINYSSVRRSQLLKRKSQENLCQVFEVNTFPFYTLSKNY